MRMTMKERWEIVPIDLAEPLPELSGEDNCSGVRAVFFWRGIPLGHCQFAMAQLPLSPQQLATVAARVTAPAIGDYVLAAGFQSALPGLPEPSPINPEQALAHLAEVERPVSRLAQAASASARRSSVTVSVAVCTRERPGELLRCLKSLTRLSERPTEILVIDNAPVSDATREIVARFPGVQYHCEPRAGLSAARNAALAIASGDIVAFTDDDVFVHPEWVTRIQACFDNEKVMVATGLVLPAELESRAQVMFEQDFQFFHQGYRRRHLDSVYFEAMRNKGVPVWSLGAGANMAIRREAFERGFTFDTRLGPGVFGGCGEDSEFWYRILAAGWSCVYEPSACVFHYHRRELSALRRQVYEYMKGHVAALILQFAKTGHRGNLRRLVLALPKEYLLLFLRLIVTGFPAENRILLRGALGCFSGLRFAFRCRQEQAATQ